MVYCLNTVAHGNERGGRGEKLQSSTVNKNILANRTLQISEEWRSARLVTAMRFTDRQNYPKHLHCVTRQAAVRRTSHHAQSRVYQRPFRGSPTGRRRFQQHMWATCLECLTEPQPPVVQVIRVCTARSCCCTSYILLLFLNTKLLYFLV